MVEGRTGYRPNESALLAEGYAIIIDPDLDRPEPLFADNQPPIIAIPPTDDPQRREEYLAAAICELARESLGWSGFCQRLAFYARVAATIMLALVWLDADGDGIPDILARLMH